MHYDNVFKILIAVAFNMIPQLGGLGPKYQYPVIPLLLGEGEYLMDFHLRSLAIKSELILMIYGTGQINNLIGK